MATYNTLTCLFGYHDYSKELTKDKDERGMCLCKHCKRSGYYKGAGFEMWCDYDERGNCTHIKDSDGYEIWYDYDEKGNMTHEKWSNGHEFWYDRKGNPIHEKWSDESGTWKNNRGNWVDKKPKNWKYEKCITN